MLQFVYYVYHLQFAVVGATRVPRRISTVTYTGCPVDFLHLALTFAPCSFPDLIFARHVILPKELAKTLPKSRLLTESEWRGIGVQQSRGWQHYAIHR